jgi:hypothetical protein
MVDPFTIAMSNSLLAGKAPGTEAAVAMTAQGTNLANSMVKANRVPKMQEATAAERLLSTSSQRLKPSRRNGNFSPPKRRSLGNKDSQTGDSHGDIASDAGWKTSGARIYAADQGSQGGQTSDPWSIATSARRLNKIDTDYVGRHLNLAA